MENVVDTQPGRTYGGTSWLVKKNIGAHKLTFINDRISILRIKSIAIIGVYLTCNDNTYTSRLEIEHELITISKIIIELKTKNIEFCIIGDFNCDIKRLNMHDKILNKMLLENNLFCIDMSVKQIVDYKYRKLDKTSWIDHIVVENAKLIENPQIQLSEWNEGDHLAITCVISSNVKDTTATTDHMSNSESTKQNKIIWNDQTKIIYNTVLEQKLIKVDYIMNENIINSRDQRKKFLEKMIMQINQCMSESADEIKVNKLITKHKFKINGWWNYEIKELFQKYKTAKYNFRQSRTSLNKILVKQTKKVFFCR